VSVDLGGPTDISGYRILRRLGSGGMGQVYLVAHPRLPREDALKLLDTGVSRDPQFRTRFQHEADLLAGLRHPNIITIYDRGEYEGRLWLTMEYIPGQDAADLLNTHGPMPLELALQIIGGAGAALDYAYSTGRITHRDVKPANILVELTPEGRPSTVKLADFGIAKAVGEGTSVTVTGMTVGTMAYMAPEALAGLPLDNRADIYSLGCTAFALLTGAPPFGTGPVAGLVMAHHSQPAPATARNPHLPPHLDAVFRRALAKAPRDRFATCAEFVAALQGAVPSEPPVGVDTQPWTRTDVVPPTRPVQSHPGPPWSPTPPVVPQSRSRRSRRWAAVAAAVAVGAGAVGIGLAVHGQSTASQVSSTASPTTADTDAPSTAPSAAPTPPTQIEMPFARLGTNVGRVAATPDGTVYVADHDNNRILKLTAGSTEQQVVPVSDLNGPNAIAIDGPGNLYVVDAGNNRVVRVAAGGGQQDVIPFSGLNAPTGVAIDHAGNLYVADSKNNRVVSLPAGSGTQQILPFTGLSGPADVAVDSGDTVYVADTGNSRIVKMPAGSTAQQALPFGGLLLPSGVAVDSAGTVYATNAAGKGSVLKLRSGSTTADPISVADLQHRPWDVTVDGVGNVYVVSYEPARVLKLAPTQTILPFTGLNLPVATAVGTDGAVYVADRGNNRVLKLAARSQQQETLPFTGLDRPMSIAIDAAGAIYVADTGNSRILKLTPGSNKPEVMAFSGLLAPSGVAAAADGTIYVTDTGNKRVLKLAPGSPDQQVLAFTSLIAPVMVAVDGRGTVYVTDSDMDGGPQQRVVKLAVGSAPQEVLPFPGLQYPIGVMVDAAGNIYVSHHGDQPQVLKLTPGAQTPWVLPFPGLGDPGGLAVDAAGNVYVADGRFNKVRVLAPA